MLLLIIVNFLLVHLAPGDPVYFLAGQSGDEKYYEFIRHKFGLDQPLATQLWIYLTNILRGDLGFSLVYQQPVGAVILGRIPATLMLTVPAICLAAIFGVILGVETARRENSWFDRAASFFALFGHSLPAFVIGMLLLLFFALYLGLFPAQGIISANQDLTGLDYIFDFLSHLLLPVTTLAIVHLAQVMRLTRAEMLGVLGESFITTARAKGVFETKVLYRHALKNALLPAATIIASDFGMLLSGAALVETVFAYPGLGRLMLESIAARDYPLLLGLFLMISVAVAALNFIVDLVYPLIDPRIRY